MKKWVAYLILLAFILGGALYLEDTLALTLSTKRTSEDATIDVNFCVRDNDNNLIAAPKVSLMPAVYDGVGTGMTKVKGESKSVLSALRGDNSFDVDLWTGITGAQDQFITVTNNGPTECYFRVYVAFENSGDVFKDWIVTNWNEKGNYSSPDYLGEAKIHGVDCSVYVLTYQETLEATHTAPPSLLQLYLKREADNQHVAALGGEYSIFAAAEAVWVPEDNVSTTFTDEERREKTAGEYNTASALTTFLGPATLNHALSLFPKTNSNP